MSRNITDDKVNIDSGNGFMSSGNKPLSEPKLTQLYVVIWPA